MGSRTETLKAQAVIARTNLWGMYLKNQSDDAQGKRDWLEPGGTEDLMTLWGASAYEKNMEKFRQAVKETRGEILTVEHQPIQAAYHYADKLQNPKCIGSSGTGSRSVSAERG